MTWPADYNKQFLATPGQNNAAGYGVTVNLAAAQSGTQYWRIIGIVHLTGAQNMGNHHVYCDVLDKDGKRITGAKIAIKNFGQFVGYVTIDKPAEEAGANVPMNSGDTIDLYLPGLASDEAQGFHTRHADEEIGNTWGHHSFYVVWQRVTAGSEPGPGPQPDPTPTPDWRKKMTGGELWFIKAQRRLKKTPEAELIDKLVRILDGEI
jgi:hypothetical protein